MVSGIPTASGYEERIRFSEMEVVDRGANEQGLVANMPEGQAINGWDVNVAGVRTVTVKKKMRKSHHAEFLIRAKDKDKPERFVGRRYGDFVRLLKQLRTEIPGKVLPPLPRKNKTHTSHILGSGGGGGGGGDGEESDSSSSTQSGSAPRDSLAPEDGGGGLRSYIGLSSHKRNSSTVSLSSVGTGSPAKHHSPHPPAERVVLYREEQRVSLRAFLRTLLQNERIANSSSLRDFLRRNPQNLTKGEIEDVGRRKDMDQQRIQEQRRFYEVARKRAAELDVHMEKFRRDIVESSRLMDACPVVALTFGRWFNETLKGDPSQGHDCRA